MKENRFLKRPLEHTRLLRARTTDWPPHWLVLVFKSSKILVMSHLDSLLRISVTKTATIIPQFCSPWKFKFQMLINQSILDQFSSLLTFGMRMTYYFINFICVKPLIGKYCLARWLENVMSNFKNVRNSNDYENKICWNMPHSHTKMQACAYLPCVHAYSL